MKKVKEVAATTTKKEAAGAKNNNRIGNIFSPLFKVKSAGYEETFSTKQDALTQADFLKKRAVKQSAPVTVKVDEIAEDGTKKTIHEIKIDDDFYN
jgi:hypothetical protein